MVRRVGFEYTFTSKLFDFHIQKRDVVNSSNTVT